jgi:hypothetical protein
MKWKLSILALGIFIMGFLFVQWPALSLLHPHTQKDLIQQIFTNQKIFDAVMSSQQVTAQLLKNDPVSPISVVDNKYGSVLLSTEQIQNVKELLGKPSSYGWGYMSDCIPHYGVIFNFESGGHTVRVAFCFECDMVAVIDGSGDTVGGNTTGYPFDPMRKQLLAMCKTIFPNSQKIQALKWYAGRTLFFVPQNKI